MGKTLAEIPLAPFGCERAACQSWSLFTSGESLMSDPSGHPRFFFPDVFARNNIYHTAVKETRALKEEIEYYF